jgi:hypothetical protein
VQGNRATSVREERYGGEADRGFGVGSVEAIEGGRRCGRSQVASPPWSYKNPPHVTQR